jgi:hypothetical protein
VKYIAAWYVFNIFYSTYTKKALIEITQPNILICLQLIICGVISIVLCGVKGFHVSTKQMHKTYKIAGCHFLGAWASIVAYGSGALGFAHVLKSGEVLFSAGFSYWLMSKTYSMSILGSMCLIVSGIVLTSIEEVSFTWICFISSNIANFFYPLRMVYAKMYLNEEKSFALQPHELHRVIAVTSMLVSTTLLLFEFIRNSNSLFNIMQNKDILCYVCLSSGSYYIYNEVSSENISVFHSKYFSGSCRFSSLLLI